MLPDELPSMLDPQCGDHNSCVLAFLGELLQALLQTIAKFPDGQFPPVDCARAEQSRYEGVEVAPSFVDLWIGDRLEAESWIYRVLATMDPNLLGSQLELPGIFFRLPTLPCISVADGEALQALPCLQNQCQQLDPS